MVGGTLRSFATRIVVYEFVGYREWTESLGFDREHEIQRTQTALYALLQEVLSKYGGFVLPLRYDYMVAIASNLGREGVKESLHVLRKASPVPVRAYSTCSRELRSAIERASTMVACLRPWEFRYEERGDAEGVAAAHIDVNYFTLKRGARFSVYESYMYVLNLILELSKKIESIGGIVHYLGGDNIISFVDCEKVKDVPGVLVGDLKVGVGIASNAKKALELAARALDEIRRTGRWPRRTLVYTEDGKRWEL